MALTGAQLATLVKKNMATIKQIDANRRNALKSTGPKTLEGKAAVSMNALRHGLRARTVVLPGENRDEFHHLCDDLEVEWQPQSRTEQFYLEQMAVSQWKLNRMEVGEANVCKETVISIKTHVPLLDRLWQAQGRMERSYARAQRELERLQNSRRREVIPEIPHDAAHSAPGEVEVGQAGQAVPPAESAAAAAPSVTVVPRVEPDPRTAGRPHPVGSTQFQHTPQPRAGAEQS
jgi:hypothetical protein